MLHSCRRRLHLADVISHFGYGRDALDVRYARGEIEREEYLQKKRDLDN